TTIITTTETAKSPTNSRKRSKTTNNSNVQQNDLPEMLWCTLEELAAAAIPTGINKAFELFQQKTGKMKINSKKSSSESEPMITSTSKKRKMTASEKGLITISKYFKRQAI